MARIDRQGHPQGARFAWAGNDRCLVFRDVDAPASEYTRVALVGDFPDARGLAGTSLARILAGVAGTLEPPRGRIAAVARQSKGAAFWFWLAGQVRTVSCRE